MELPPISAEVPGRGAPRAILDIRAPEVFAAGHLPGAVSHPLPDLPLGPAADSILEAQLPSIFLPPRQLPLLVVADDAERAATVVRHLTARGRPAVTGIRPPAAGKSETGPNRRHLWTPPDWLVRHEDLLPPPAAGPVLDLACGSGRAAVWLAERGYRVTAIDRQAEALALGRRLASSRRVAVDFRVADLRQLSAVPPGPWAVLLDFRYLQRDLLARFGALVQPGGLALVRTFRAAPGYDGPPRTRHCLGAGELLRVFASGEWSVVAHETSHDADRRPAAGIVARRNST